jgi:hypothetical protein
VKGSNRQMDLALGSSSVYCCLTTLVVLFPSAFLGFHGDVTLTLSIRYTFIDIKVRRCYIYRKLKSIVYSSYVS